MVPNQTSSSSNMLSQKANCLITLSQLSTAYMTVIKFESIKPMNKYHFMINQKNSTLDPMHQTYQIQQQPKNETLAFWVWSVSNFGYIVPRDVRICPIWTEVLGRFSGFYCPWEVTFWFSKINTEPFLKNNIWLSILTRLHSTYTTIYHGFFLPFDSELLSLSRSNGCFFPIATHSDLHAGA